MNKVSPSFHAMLGHGGLGGVSSLCGAWGSAALVLADAEDEPCGRQEESKEGPHDADVGPAMRKVAWASERVLVGVCLWMVARCVRVCAHVGKGQLR